MTVDNDIQEIFESQTGEAYRRFDKSHPFNIYLGFDTKGRKSLAAILNAGREKTQSSQSISVEFFKRSRDENMMCFCLEDNSLSEMFYKFCEDIIESTRQKDTSDGFGPIVDRWNTWIKFFSKTTLSLSESEIIGLIGEVYFLKNVMVGKYGLDDALTSYIGTDRAHKDFEIQDTWYEVKSIHNGVRSVKISSIEQLDSAQSGKLEIITFDQSTPTYKGNITLNEIISGFRDMLERKWQLLFDEKMRKVGYLEDERYDEYNYQFVKIDEYNVANDFPKLSKDTLPNGVTKASYEIDISAIQRFKV